MLQTIKIYGHIIRRLLEYFALVASDNARLRPGIFIFQDQAYQYFYHSHNHTWDNERAVEIPLTVNELLKMKDKNVLELGNVLSHYMPITHDVVDKYEPGPQVKNVDIIDYHPAKKYDLIISISTLEHVGWDENPQTLENIHQKNKTAIALDHMVKLLKKNGTLFITVPLGYNHDLDELLMRKKLKVDSVCYLKRQNTQNQWLEVSSLEAKKIKYGSPYRNANGLAVLMVKKK